MDLPEEALQSYRRAGRIAAEVREKVRGLVFEDMPVIDLCERVENLIREGGGSPAFPCNVSINEVAAHYTSPPRDEMRVPRGSIVKVDIGVHVDGYIADTAVTVCFNPELENLVDCAEEALNRAIKILRPGLSVSDFSSVIQKIIRDRGFKPISNLTGHQIGRYLVHTGKPLPNVSHFSVAKINLGEVYGVEPFVTLPDAVGTVKDQPQACIFRLLKPKSLKNPYARQLLDFARRNFRTLPFTERWLKGVLPQDHYEAAFSELLASKSLMAYPILAEASKKPVAQAEHTVLIVKEGCLVLT